MHAEVGLRRISVVRVVFPSSLITALIKVAAGGPTSCGERLGARGLACRPCILFNSTRATGDKLCASYMQLRALLLPFYRSMLRVHLTTSYGSQTASLRVRR